MKLDNESTQKLNDNAYRKEGARYDHFHFLTLQGTITVEKKYKVYNLNDKSQIVIKI